MAAYASASPAIISIVAAPVETAESNTHAPHNRAMMRDIILRIQRDLLLCKNDAHCIPVASTKALAANHQIKDTKKAKGCTLSNCLNIKIRKPISSSHLGIEVIVFKPDSQTGIFHIRAVKTRKSSFQK